MELLENEKLYLEDTKVKVRQTGSTRGALFLGCRVIYTDKRILIGQKIIFIKKYTNRYIIEFIESEPERKTNLKMTYLQLFIKKSEITVEEDKKNTYIRIPIPEHLLTGSSQYILIQIDKSKIPLLGYFK